MSPNASHYSGAYDDVKTNRLAAEAAQIHAGNPELDAEGDSDDEDDDPTQVKPFEGDYFGDYTAADWEDYDTYQGESPVVHTHSNET